MSISLPHSLEFHLDIVIRTDPRARVETASFCVNVSVMSALMHIYSYSTRSCSGSSTAMELAVIPALQTAGYQVCRPVRGCSPAKQGLDVAQCASPYASTGRAGLRSLLEPCFNVSNRLCWKMARLEAWPYDPIHSCSATSVCMLLLRRLLRSPRVGCPNPEHTMLAYILPIRPEA